MRVVLSLFLAFVAITSYAQTIPTEHFVKHGDYLDMQLSPDGRRIAARVRNDGKVSLIVLDTASMKPVGGIRPNNNDSIHTVQWITNERLVFELAEKFHYLDRPIETGELFAVNYDGSRHSILYGFRAGDEKLGSRISNREDNYASQQVISRLEDDDDYILIAEYPWSKRANTFYDDRKKNPVISKLDVRNGRKRQVEVIPFPGAQVFANAKGQVNFVRWQDENGKTQSAFRQSAEAPWQPLDELNEKLSGLAPVSLSKDGSTLVLGGRIGDNLVYTLFNMDLTNGDVSPVFGAHASDVEDWIADSTTGLPVVAITYPGRSEYLYTDAKSSTLHTHKMLVGAFEGQTVNISSMTQDGKTLLVHVSSDVNPGEYYLFDRETLNAQFLWANSSWIDPRHMNPKRPFVMQTKDNVELHGYITLPKASSNAKPPLVVMIHGGPHQPGTQDGWYFDPEVQLLANRGFAVLQVNFRGSDGYGQRFVEMGYRQWGGKMIDDIVEATQWAVSEGLVDGNRICAYGASFGGYAALMAAIRAPDLYKCTVGYVGIYDLNFMYTESDIPNNWGGQAYLQRVLGDDQQQLMEFSPINHVDKIRAKVMLIHGAKDKRVPEINAEVLKEKLEAVNNPPVYLKYRQSGHGVWNEESRMDLYNGLQEFLSTHLK